MTQLVSFIGKKVKCPPSHPLGTAHTYATLSTPLKSTLHAFQDETPPRMGYRRRMGGVATPTNPVDPHLLTPCMCAGHVYTHICTHHTHIHTHAHTNTNTNTNTYTYMHTNRAPQADPHKKCFSIDSHLSFMSGNKCMQTHTCWRVQLSHVAGCK